MQKTHVGNIVIVHTALWHEILLLHKLPENEADKLRKRKRVGINCWGLAGGARKETDTSDRHGAKRETFEETGLVFELDEFVKIGVLEGFRQKETLERIWLAHIYKVRATPEMMSQVKINHREHDQHHWFQTRAPDEIPWGQMIESDKLWLPELLKDKRLTIQVVFDGDAEKVLDCNFQEAAFSENVLAH